MIILDELKRIIEAAPVGVPFNYGSFLDLNSDMDFNELPAVCCQLIPNGAMQNEGGQLKDSADVLLMFIDKTEYDITALENQLVIDEQKVKVRAFINELRDSVLIENTVPVTRYDNIYNEFDVNVTGVAIRLSLKELQGTYECPSL